MNRTIGMRAHLTILAVLMCSCVWGFDKYDVRAIRAEDALCEGNLNRAFRNYRRAFRIMGVDMPSSTLYTFFVVAVDAKRFSRAKPLLAELKQRGWAFSDYHDHLANYYHGAELDALDKLYAASGSCSTSSIDQDLTRKVDSLVALDQRVDKYMYTFEEGSEARRMMHDSFITLTRNNMMALRNLFAERYPSDRELGRMNGPFSGPPYQIIVIHAVRQRSVVRLLDTILYTALREKKLKATHFENLVAMEPKEHGYERTVSVGDLSLILPMNPYSYGVVNDSLFLFPVSAAKIDSCNYERRKINGLVSCEQLKARIEFQYYHSKYALLDDLSCVIRFDYPLPQRIKRQLIYIPAKS